MTQNCNYRGLSSHQVRGRGSRHLRRVVMLPLHVSAVPAFTALLLVTGPGAAAAEAEIEIETETKTEPSPWAGTLEVYGFAPLRTSIDTDVGAFSASDDFPLSKILENLDAIAYIRGSVEHNRIGILADISYVSVGAQQSRSTQGSVLGGRLPIATTDQTRIGFDQGIYDLALRYRFGEREQAVGKRGDATLIPYAGIRILDVETDVSVDIQRSFPGGALERRFQGSAGEPVVQPLIGLQGQVFLSPRLRLFARGDLGGLENDNLSGNAQLGVGYAIGNSAQLNLSWRYLYLEQGRGGTRPRSYEISENGVELGVKFFF